MIVRRHSIVNKLAPGLIPKVNTSSLAFKQMENLSNYLNACSRLGMNQTALFQTIDLYEGKDMLVVRPTPPIRMPRAEPSAGRLTRSLTLVLGVRRC